MNKEYAIVSEELQNTKLVKIAYNMGDRVHMSEKIQNIVEILKTYPKNCHHLKIHLKTDMTDKMMKNVFKGMKLPVLYDEIVGFWDGSVPSNCKKGILFTENGCYISRTLKHTYYTKYTDIKSCESKGYYSIISINNGDVIEILAYYDDIANTLRDIFISLKNYSNMVKVDSENNSGSVKNIKDFITKNEYDLCKKIIHSASIACGGVGATPHIPLSDTIVMTPIQIGMLINLGEVFSVKLTDAMAKSVLYSCIGAIVGRNISSIAIGWIPFLGNAVNAATGFSLTEAIGWKFVHDYATNKNAIFKTNLSEAVQVFQDKMNALSQKEFLRFVKDLNFICGQNIEADRNKVNDVFFDIVAQYTFESKTDISNVIPEYTNNLKDILKKSEHAIQANTRAEKYYNRFKHMEFPKETLDFEKVADFVEQFLGFYNMLYGVEHSKPISNFQFNIENENPTKFFNELKNDKKKNNKELQKKYMICALTSLFYSYAADREGGNA